MAGELVAAPGGVDLAVEGGMARLPELIGKSDLLTEGHMAALYRELPPRVEGRSMHQIVAQLLLDIWKVEKEHVLMKMLVSILQNEC